MRLLFKFASITALFFVCGMFGCKKAKNTSVASTDFTWSGTALIGDTIHFINNAGGNLLWDFGDLTTSTISHPYHVYDKGGFFTVKLTVNGDTTITKIIAIYTDPIYTRQMIGPRQWHQVYTRYIESQPPDSSSSDATWSITYIDPITIAIGADTLTYTGTDSTVLSFHETFYFAYDHPSGSYADLKFDYAGNSIWFEFYNRIGAGGYSTSIYTTH